MIVAPLLQRYFFGAKEPGVFRQILGETIAAHLVTIPIIALSFGTISHVAIIANLLVVPFVPIAMLLTFLVGVGEILHIAFIEILGQVTSWLLGYMVVVAQYVASLSWAQTPITAEGWVWVVYGVLLVAGCWWMWRATAYSFRSGESPL
jgi:competence protein ComEC